jgi:carboxylesterase type B
MFSLYLLCLVVSIVSSTEYLGIPYAQPPTGSLRWKPTQATSLVFNPATHNNKVTPVCMQELTGILLI